MRSGLGLVLILSWFAGGFAAGQGAPPKPLTVDQIFRQPSLQTESPQEMAWSPDGSKLVYIRSNGDLMEVEGYTGKQRVLAGSEKMGTLTGRKPSSAQQRASFYRGRSCFWAPDSKNLLFDTEGRFWFFDVKTGVGVELASTGDGSWGDPKFSPDGAYLSYLRNQNLYVLDLALGQTTYQLTDTVNDAVLNGDVDRVYREELGTQSNYFWSPDSKHIAYLQMNESRVPAYPIESWFPSHAKVENQHYPQPGDLNPAVKLGVVTPKSGKTRWIRIPIAEGQDYIPRFGWIDANTLWIETLTRDQKKRTLYFADIGKGEAEAVLSQSDEKFINPSYDIEIAAGNILLTSWQDGHNHLYLYHYDSGKLPESGATLVRQLTRGNWEVSRIAGVDLAKQTVYYLSNENDPRQQQIWAIRLDGTGKHQVSTSGAWHDPVFSQNAKFYADTISSTMKPPQTSVCRQETACTSLWQAPPLDARLLSPIGLELKAADNMTTLYGELLLPGNKHGMHSVPLIVNPYGGPEVQTVTEQWHGTSFLFDQILAEHGFAVLHVDNRGMAGRGRDFSQAAYHNFGPIQMSDQIAALDQVLAKYPQLDPKRLGWWGRSWGGTFTLYAMTHSTRFRAGVSFAPVTDWHNYDSIYTERYLGMPTGDSGLYSEMSLIPSAKNLQGRLLLVHGTADDNVHFGNSIQFVQQLIDENLPYEFQIYPGESHHFSSVEASTDLYNRILAHFERSLMNPPCPPPGATEPSRNGEAAH